jgi:hypothetical protein
VGWTWVSYSEKTDDADSDFVIDDGLVVLAYLIDPELKG